MSKEDIIKESLQLLDSLYRNNNNAVEITSTADKLRENVMTFVSTNLKEIGKREALINLIDAAMVEKVMLHELTTEELRAWRNDLMSGKNTTIDSLMRPFQPTNATPSSLMPPALPKQDGDEDIDKKLTPDGRAALNHLMTIVMANLDKEKK